ncbi:hypothetical protein [Chryseobacterium sediminis]|uniref:hypothetical protein n=1 Tax=Chryseobacterium sediminis TaxID=1679494 RepID=UPI00285E697A|nr:hypothetical protein [Chryseobacterium sediminis]MDR6462681.1 hypothetical protein [Chryseobacterium sediminis]
MTSLVPILAALIVAGITLYNFRIGRQDSKKNSKILDLQDKKKVIEEKINDFYIPLGHQLGYSKTLFKIFIVNKPEDFKTLTYLLDPDQIYSDIGAKVILNENDNALLETIINIGQKVETLIYEKSYLIGDDLEFVDKYIPGDTYRYLTNPNDLSILNLLLSHIITIRLAFEKKLTGERSKFENYVFPAEINSKIDQKLLELRSILQNYDNQINALRL